MFIGRLMKQFLVFFSKQSLQTKKDFSEFFQLEQNSENVTECSYQTTTNKRGRNRQRRKSISSPQKSGLEDFSNMRSCTRRDIVLTKYKRGILEILYALRTNRKKDGYSQFEKQLGRAKYRKHQCSGE